MIVTGTKHTTRIDEAKGIFETEELMVEEIRKGKPCYYCARPVGLHCIWWQGAGENIALHSACAVTFATHLLSDTQALERETGIEVITQERDKHSVPVLQNRRPE